MDALSDDGRYGLTLIAFVGSVFSPYYAWSGRRDPENHCAINVALYGGRTHRWTMTEHGRGQVARTQERFSIAASALTWRGDALEIDLRETAAPIPMPVRGRITLTPRFAPQTALAIDPQGRHWWAPIAPVCDVALEMTAPALSWRGLGYLDSNGGTEPLETGFRQWDWTRAHQGDGCLVAYRGQPRAGGALDMMLRLRADGSVTDAARPPVQHMPRTIWGLPRTTRAQTARLRRTLEDAPFYARSELWARFDGHDGPAMHESLDLDRFASAWVKTLLPVRMPRRR